MKKQEIVEDKSKDGIITDAMWSISHDFKVVPRYTQAEMDRWILLNSFNKEVLLKRFNEMMLKKAQDR